jgi:hypothetical protein
MDQMQGHSARLVCFVRSQEQVGGFVRSQPAMQMPGSLKALSKVMIKIQKCNINRNTS